MLSYFLQLFNRKDSLFLPPLKKMISINNDVELTRWNIQLELVQTFKNYNIPLSSSYWCFSNGVTWSLFDYNLKKKKYFSDAIKLINDENFDTLHSFGGYDESNGKKITRTLIKKALKILNDNKLKTKIYTNHGGSNDKQNIGGDIPVYQMGDMKNSKYYNLDLLLEYGINFFWTDDDYDNILPVKKINQDFSNSLIKPHLTRDGSNILRFSRFRGNFGTKKAPTINNFHEQIKYVVSNTDSGFSIIYQHLGCNRLQDNSILPVSNLKNHNLEKTLMILEKKQKSGELIITTTQKLLMYAIINYFKCWNLSEFKDSIDIFLHDKVKVFNNQINLNESDYRGWFIKTKKEKSYNVFFKKKKNINTI